MTLPPLSNDEALTSARAYLYRTRWIVRPPAIFLVPSFCLTAVGFWIRRPLNPSLTFQYASVFVAFIALMAALWQLFVTRRRQSVEEFIEETRGHRGFPPGGTKQ